MKSQISCNRMNPSFTRGLIRLSLLLCFIAAPLIAQTASKGNTQGLSVSAPQVSELNTATLQATGTQGTYITHYGTVLALGYFTTVGGREVVIQWDQGGGSRQQGNISDAQWEIFKLAFAGSGRISVLSDFVTNWQFDYRFLEAEK